MRIGTTPTHTFELPFNVAVIDAVEITYCQNKKIVLQKNEDDCTMGENIVAVTLSQQDTFKFTPDVNVEIQIRIVGTDGNVYASDIMCVSCGRCLSDEVI